MGIKKQVGGKDKLEPKHYAIAKKLAKESNLSEQSFLKER